MASMELRMEARKSELVERGSGGGDGRRRSRRPSGLHWHWLSIPPALVDEGSDVVAVAELPVGLALTLNR